MDTPEENPDGYAESSVLKYVENYRGNLRLTHGSIDDNVHMQNSMQFIEKMTELGKYFDLMIYPNERHGIRGAKRDHYTKSAVQWWFENLLDDKDLSTAMDIQR